MPEKVKMASPIGKPDSETLSRINRKLRECAEKLNYDYELPTVSFDLKGRTAGQAFYSGNRIRLNLELLNKNREEMIENTLPHEFAHIAAFKFYGEEGKGHGHYWKLTMMRLGLEPKRCHNMEVTPARKHQKFDYSCKCPGKVFKIGKNVHEKIQSGRPRYCPSCRADVVYIGEGNGMRGTGKIPFEKWLERVDLELTALVGMIRDDLPDYDYWSSYEAGNSPNTCAKKAIRNAMGY